MTYYIKSMVLCVAAAAAVSTVSAQSSAAQHTTVANADACGLRVTDVSLTRNDALMSVSMTLQTRDFKVHRRRAAIFTPTLVNGGDTLALTPVGMYSRAEWIQYLREGRKPLGGEGEMTMRWKNRTSKHPAVVEYEQNVAYLPWMNGATLWLRRADYGCSHAVTGGCTAPLAGWREVTYEPVFEYVTPRAEAVKERVVSGSAYIDFATGRTDVRVDFRNNDAELQKIVSTIDAVRRDGDVTLRRITIKGYSSPEGYYSDNSRLSKGRTEALKRYVLNLYRMDEGLIATDYEAEDWDGLRAFVAESGLEHREAILSVIDDDRDCDSKDWHLKIHYPDDYAFLLNSVFPTLRRTDYRIEYTVRGYGDVTEIARMLRESPQKLSLEEMYVLSRTLEPGSEAYNEVFETAVRMYPTDAVANLNAANAAMQRRDMTSAGRYLSKAGDSDAAVYARGVYSALSGDYAGAVGLFESVSSRMESAAAALTTVRALAE